MKKTLKNKWLAALRSGEYKQTTDSLKTVENYMCCLGVLADVASNGKIWNEEVMLHHRNVIGAENLPEDIAEQYGLCDSSGRFKFESLPDTLKRKIYNVYVSEPNRYMTYEQFLHHKEFVHLSLARLNDDGVPFEIIAEIIEANPEGLFIE